MSEYQPVPPLFVVALAALGLVVAGPIVERLIQRLIGRRTARTIATTRALGGAVELSTPFEDYRILRMQRAEQAVATLREALLRNRQGYLNILEMRKLSSEKWGERDGYGGRYGALTREEIEGVIADIDAALAITEPTGKTSEAR